MTPRTLFSIVLKVFGIFLIKDIIAGLIQTFATIFYFQPETSEAILGVFFSFIILGVYVGFSYVLIFKTEFLIDKLKLDQDLIEKHLNMQLSKSMVLEIALIVTGSIVLFNEIPNLFRYLYKYYEERKMTFGGTHPEISYSVFAAVKILLALLIIGERKRIIRFIDKKEDINPSE